MRRLLWVMALMSGAVLAASPMIWLDGNYGKMLTALGFKFDDGKEVRTIAVDPSAGAGVVADIGSLALQNDSGAGKFWFKLTSSDTGWTDVLTGGSGWSLFGNAGTTPGTGAGESYLGTSDAVDLVFGTTDTERLRISASGVIDTTLGLGLIHSDASGLLTSSLIVNADVAAAAAIAGTKISPDFGSQNITSTGDLIVNGAQLTDLGFANGIVKTSSTGVLSTALLVDANVHNSAGINATKLSGGLVDNDEYNYLNGVTSSIQTQLDTKIQALSAIGAVPNANGATITGTTLNLQPANASFGGVVTTGAQTFAGAKTLASLLVSDLTTGRIPLISTAGLLIDNAAITHSGGNIAATQFTGNLVSDTFKALTSAGAQLQSDTGTLIATLGASSGSSAQWAGTQVYSASTRWVESGGGTDTVNIVAPASIAATFTLTLPDTNGDPDQVLSTDGSGVLSWVAAGGLTVSGSVASPNVVVAATGIAAPTVSNNYMVYVAGNSGNINITANPQIADGIFNGQELCLVGTSDTDTVTLEDGDGLDQNGAAVLGVNDEICYKWNLTDWRESTRAIF